jgi:dipeptidyl aminopeptidase/acylaminoacyl peptidase
MNVFRLTRISGLWRLVAASAALGTTAVSAEARPFGVDDVWGFEQPAHVQLSPDGRRLIYSRTRRDPVTDSRVTTLQYTSDLRTYNPLGGPLGCTLAAWSPDSLHVALVCSRDKLNRLIVHDVDSGSDRDIVQSPAALTRPVWSPDGKMLAYQAIGPVSSATLGDGPEPAAGEVRAPGYRLIDRLFFRVDGEGDLPAGYRQTFVVVADGSSPPRRLTRGIWWKIGDMDLSWSRDGLVLYLSGSTRPDWDRVPEQAAIYSVRVTDGDVQLVVDHHGTASRPLVSPDGRWLAYLDVDERGLSVQNQRIRLRSLHGGEDRILTATFDRSIASMIWAPDSKSLIGSYEDHAQVRVARFALSGAVRVLATDMAGGAIELPFGGTDFSVAANGSIGYVRSLSGEPPQVALVDRRGHELLATHLNRDLVRDIGGFLSAQQFGFRASTDGIPIDAWVMLPRTASNEHPVPLILDIHGGPFGAYGDRFSLKYQLFLAAGYAVLYVDPRGSTGYGEAFANLAHDAWPGHDVEDLLDAVKIVGQRPEIDAHNFFATGTSGGATLTLELAARIDPIRAGVAVKPVVDWTSWVLDSDVGNFLYRRWFAGKLPWGDGADYWARSPLRLAPLVHIPVLLMAGEQDLRVPASEAVQMYSALKILGKDAALMLAPEVTHESGRYRPSVFLQECSATLDWFERYRTHEGL